MGLGKFGQQHHKMIYSKPRNRAIRWDFYEPLLNVNPIIWSCFKGRQQRLFKNSFIKQLVPPRTQLVSSWRKSIRCGITAEANVSDAASLYGPILALCKGGFGAESELSSGNSFQSHTKETQCVPSYQAEPRSCSATGRKKLRNRREKYT